MENLDDGKKNKKMRKGKSPTKVGNSPLRTGRR